MNKKIRNRSFFLALKAYTVKAAKILEESGPVPSYVIDNRWVVEGNGQFRRKEVKSSNCPMGVYLIAEQLKELQEYKKCAQLIAKSSRLSKYNGLVGTHRSRTRIISRELINNILKRLLSTQDNYTISLRKFNSAYLELERYLYSDSLTIERITPLAGFSSRLNSIKINDEISIIKLSEQQTLDLLNLGIKLGSEYSGFMYQKNQFAIQIKYSTPKQFGDFKKKAEKIKYEDGALEQTMLDLLRLYKTGEVYSLGTVVNDKDLFRNSFSYNLNIHFRVASNTYKFTNNDMKKFGSFWHQANDKNVTERRFLSVALRRFSQARERIQKEDEIIDLLICAEALFLNQLGSNRGELRYRLSHRAALFIEESQLKRVKLFKFMKNIYDVRSAIVHGTDKKLEMPSKEDGTKYNINELCTITEDYLRRALIKSIHLAQMRSSPKYLIDWEELVFNLG